MFKTREGGGGQRPFKQCLKKLHNWLGMASLSQMLTIADKGGGVLKKYQQRVVMGTKMRIEWRIDLDLTIHVHQSHVTCKLDLTNEYPPFHNAKKVHVENFSTKRASGKC